MTPQVRNESATEHPRRLPDDDATAENDTGDIGPHEPASKEPTHIRDETRSNLKGQGGKSSMHSTGHSSDVSTNSSLHSTSRGRTRVQRRPASLESAKSYHSRVSGSIKSEERKGAESYDNSSIPTTSGVFSNASVKSRTSSRRSNRSRTSMTSQRSRRSDRMRRKKNMSELIKATKGTSMPLATVRDEGSDASASKQSKGQIEDGNAALRESRFYGWGEFSDSNFSDSASKTTQNDEEEKVELYVAFPDKEEVEASVTDSAASGTFDEIVFHDEYDSRRPWRKAPPVETISCASKSTVSDSTSIFSEAESKGTKVSTLTDSMYPNRRMNKRMNKGKGVYQNSQIGAIISANKDDNGDNAINKSQKSYSGSDVSEIAEARAALRQSQVALAGRRRAMYPAPRSVASRSNSFRSIGSEFSMSTPVYRKPEPFRPGPSFERKFMKSERQISLGSLIGYPSESSLISMEFSSLPQSDNPNNEKSDDIESGKQSIENRGNSESDRRISFQSAKSNSAYSLSSDSDADDERIHNAVNRFTLTSTPALVSTGNPRRYSRKSSALDRVDEIEEAEDEWDAVSISSDHKEQEQDQLSFSDLEDGLKGIHEKNTLDSRNHERNKMMELTSIMYESGDGESLESESAPRPNQQPKSVMSRVSTQATIRLDSSCALVKRKFIPFYRRHRVTILFSICISVVVAAGITLFLVLRREENRTPPSPTLAPSRNKREDTTVDVIQPSPSPTKSPIGQETDLMTVNEPTISPRTSMIPSLNPSMVPSVSYSFDDSNINTKTTLSPSPTMIPSQISGTLPSQSMKPSQSIGSTQSPSQSMKPSQSMSPTPSPSQSMKPSQSMSPTPSPSQSMKPSQSMSPTQSPSMKPSQRNIPTLSSSPSPSQSMNPTQSPSQSMKPSQRRGSTSSPYPSFTPSQTKKEEENIPSFNITDTTVTETKSYWKADLSPSPTVVFTMWPTPLDTYSKRYPPPYAETGYEFDSID